MSKPTATRQALLAARLEAVMLRQGLSVRQLAIRAGLPLSVVQKLIAGEGRQTSVWTLTQLTDTLAVSLDYLAGRTNSEKGGMPSLLAVTGSTAATDARRRDTQRPRTRTAASVG